MAQAAPATEGNEARRRAMLEAAAELISERGFGETRIADVAARAGASSALVIYYFGTRDRLLVDALRFSEESSTTPRARCWRRSRTSGTGCRCSSSGPASPRSRARSAAPGARGWTSGPLRSGTPRSGRHASSLDGRWRDLIERVVRAGQEDGVVGDLDVRRFALTFSVLLDGLATQVALADEEITRTWPSTWRWSTPSNGWSSTGCSSRRRQGRRRQRLISTSSPRAWPPHRGGAPARPSANQHATRSPGSAAKERGPAWLATWTTSTWSATSTRTWVAAPR